MDVVVVSNEFKRYQSTFIFAPRFLFLEKKRESGGKFALEQCDTHVKLDEEKSDTGGSCSYENSYATSDIPEIKRTSTLVEFLFSLFDSTRNDFIFSFFKIKVGLNEIQGQDWITFPSGSISRNDYITAKKKCFAWLVAGQPCRKLREFRRIFIARAKDDT